MTRITHPARLGFQLSASIVPLYKYSHGEALYFCLDDYNNGDLNMPSRDLFE